MKVIELISKIGQQDNSHVDITRYTTTNTPDNGYDIGLHHTEKHFDEMLKVSSGNLSKFSDPKDDCSKKIQTRIDVKNENNKITKPVAEKFVADIKKHPDCEGHLLIGNNGLTKGAEQILSEANEKYSDKKIDYISNDGVKKLKETVDEDINKKKSMQSETKKILNHEKTPKHPLHHYSRYLSTQRTRNPCRGARPQKSRPTADSFHWAYFLFWECAGVAVFIRILRRIWGEFGIFH